jgi:predicted kinase
VALDINLDWIYIRMKLIILVGLPGSGKSTYAKHYEDTGWVVLNQDKLGSRQKCIDLMKEAFANGDNVVIDRTNISREQRSYFIKEANAVGVTDINCHAFLCKINTCYKRICKRKDHPTITFTMTKRKKKMIIDKFITSYEKPTLDEGFKDIKYVSSEEDINFMAYIKKLVDTITGKCKYIFTSS